MTLNVHLIAPKAVSTFSKMPTLIVGHEYLLMVSHFTDTQSGYTLILKVAGVNGQHCQPDHTKSKKRLWCLRWNTDRGKINKP
jgi:hypothetical protein